MSGRIKVKLGHHWFNKCWKCREEVDTSQANTFTAYDYNQNKRKGIFYSCPSCYREFMEWCKKDLPEGYEIFFVINKNEILIYNRPDGSKWLPEI